MPKRETGEVLRTWEELQDAEWQRYKRSPQGVFSVQSHPIAIRVGAVVSARAEGLCLDVGCGCLERPAYMMGEFVGVDPFFGDRRRAFPFAQAVGERLPFASGSFDAVLFASTIDHCWNPTQALKEARRVLRQEGNLLIWYARRHGLEYEAWKREGGVYKGLHQWAFDDRTMNALIKECGFRPLELVRLDGKNKNRILIAR